KRRRRRNEIQFQSRSQRSFEHRVSQASAWHGGPSRNPSHAARKLRRTEGSTRRCFAELLERNRRRSACARSNQPASAAGRIPLHSIPLGLRQVPPLLPV